MATASGAEGRRRSGLDGSRLDIKVEKHAYREGTNSTQWLTFYMLLYLHQYIKENVFSFHLYVWFSGVQIGTWAMTQN